MYCYFFKGNQYIRVTRGRTGPGDPPMDKGYPASISAWDWGSFGANGIDASLFSGSKCYFFKGNQYIRVTRGDTGPGSVDAGYPAPISNWDWGSFGANGIDAALWSGPKCYFFKGNQYIRVSRGETGPGTVDHGYPAPISKWGWGTFGANGINAALFSETVDYFFSGSQYIRVTRGATGPGKVDAGYPQQISPPWGWGSFKANGIDAALYSGEPGVSVDWSQIGNGIVTIAGLVLNGLEFSAYAGDAFYACQLLHAFGSGVRGRRWASGFSDVRASRDLMTEWVGNSHRDAGGIGQSPPADLIGHHSIANWSDPATARTARELASAACLSSIFQRVPIRFFVCE